MSDKCDACPAKDWLCEYYCFKPECAKLPEGTGNHELCKRAATDKMFQVMQENEYIQRSTLQALGVPPGFLGARRDKEYVMELRAMVEYFLTVKREFCTCVVDAFCNKTDEKCDKCKEYDQMVEKAKKLLGEKE